MGVQKPVLGSEMTKGQRGGAGTRSKAWMGWATVRCSPSPAAGCFPPEWGVLCIKKQHKRSMSKGRARTHGGCDAACKPGDGQLAVGATPPHTHPRASASSPCRRHGEWQPPVKSCTRGRPQGQRPGGRSAALLLQAGLSGRSESAPPASADGRLGRHHVKPITCTAHLRTRVERPLCQQAGSSARRP